MPAEFQHVKGHGNIFHRTRRLLNQFVDLGMCGKMDNQI
jgi:hypothetical protein